MTKTNEKRGEMVGRVKLLMMGYKLKDVIRKGFISFSDYYNGDYDELRIPTSFLREPDRSIVEHFGVERASGLDWALIRMNRNIAVHELLKLDPDTENINTQLYQRLKHSIPPTKFSPQMKRMLPECCFLIEGREPRVKERFNQGELTISELILNWDIMKDKDLTYCIDRQLDGLPKTLDNEKLKDLMSGRVKLMQAIARCTGDNYFFRMLGCCSTESEENSKIRQKVDTVLIEAAKTHKYVANDDYREFFKASPITDHMKRLKISELLVKQFENELANEPENFLATQPIPYTTFFDSETLRKITDRGLSKSASDYEKKEGIFASQKNGKNIGVSYLRLLRGDKNGDRNER